MPNEAANMATLWANNVSSGILSRADERLKIWYGFVEIVVDNCD
jgi:hypothetical protein